MQPNPSLPPDSPAPVDEAHLSDNLISMETTLTEFQRNFGAVREAADRGETIQVKSGETTYIFAKASGRAARPFADLEPLFGVVHRARRAGTAHDIIRDRLSSRRPD
jgi:hypothetical protein